MFFPEKSFLLMNFSGKFFVIKIFLKYLSDEDFSEENLPVEHFSGLFYEKLSEQLWRRNFLSCKNMKIYFPEENFPTKIFW
jgi:hypothetical protein